MVKILFTADIQVKNREKSLYRGQEKTLLEIESKLKETKAEIYLAAGDFWEYATPNDSERKLIYNHFARVLAIESVKEVVLIAGNHDLEKDKKQLDTQIGFNPINIFADFVTNLDDTLSSKITYLQSSKSYLSKCSNIEWVSYSLEDEEKWRPLDGITKRHPTTDPSDTDQSDTDQSDTEHNIKPFKISIYHDILREYVDEVKLPIRKEKYNTLLGVSDFVGDLILAGDIHLNYIHTNLDKQTFMYPGSPVQHTHNEGCFIKINESSVSVNPADNKVVKLVYVNDDGLGIVKWYSEDILLTDQICYNTITFDNVSPAHCIEQLKLILDKIKFGEEQSFIKVKLSNILVSKEMEIDGVLRTLSMSHKRVQISFAYDKFIDLTKSANQSIINELRNEVCLENKTDIDSETTIDDLILDNDKLHKLFNKVLDNQLPNINNELSAEITEEEIKSNILNLFDEQLGQSLSGSQKYNIVFESIETNGFMKLGANKIDLNIPGVVRISGTNGIGKTTLFHMLRWLLKDETFEGLKKNTKIKNTLIIFNDKKAEEDLVCCKLFIMVNNTPVVITRSATRTWKKGTELKQKQSIYWKDFISGVDKTITVNIIKDDKEINYTGEQAEKAISLWFGNTINTIMFLNQPKILNILNITPMELKELILNYIGVDYLEKLENNLEALKTEYNLVRPKRDRDTIRENIIDQKILISKINTDIDDAHIVIEETTKTLNLFESEKDIIIDNQISLGNIQELIDGKKEEISLKEIELNTFEEQQPKDKIPFEEQKPIEPDLSLLEKDIESNKETQSDINNKLNVFVSDIDMNYQFMLDIINSNNKKSDEHFTGLIDNENNTLSYLKEERTKAFGLINDKLFNTVKALENNKESIDNTLQEEQLQKQTLSNEIVNLENLIKSGVCKECGKPMTNDWDNHKSMYINKLNFAKESMVVLNDSINVTKEKITKSKNLIDIYRNYFEISLKNIVKTDYEEKSKVIDYVMEVTNSIIDIDKGIVNCSNNIKEYNRLYSSDITESDSLKYLIVSKNTKQLDSMLFEDNLQVLYDKISSLNSESIKLKDSLSNIIKHIDDCSSEISNLNNNYIKQLKEYQELYDTNTKYNMEIESYNSGVEKHNQQKALINNSLLTLKNNLLILESNLPKWIELNNQLIECNKNLLIYENQQLQALNILKESEIKINTEKIKLDSLNVEYQNYIDYVKKNLIWKLYSNLIKVHFKDIVFEYYRGFLNNTLNSILEDVNFKLMWNNDGELYMIDFQDGFVSYRPVQQTSGMETCFLGLTLIYSLHLLNIKNSISNIFIDELSGQLNKGDTLNYSASDYQELFVLLLSKFKDKTIMIIDHNIKNLFESMTYEVQPTEGGSKYIKII